ATMAVTLAGALGCWMLGGRIVDGLRALLTAGLGPAAARDLDAGAAFQALADGIVAASALLAPLLVLLALAAVAGPVVIGGVVFSGAACRPKLSRLDPLQGLRRIFSAQG